MKWLLSTEKSEIQDLQWRAWLKRGSILAKPGKWVLAGWGQGVGQSSFYFKDFFQNESFFDQGFVGTAVWDWEEWKNKVAQLSDTKINVQWQESGSKDFFESAFLKLKNEIQESALTKAVPSLVKEGKLKGENATSYLLKQCSVATTGFVFGAWSENESIVGVTPELFFSRDANKLNTMALAGTLLKGPNKSLSKTALKEFMNDFKEIAEHQFVVEGIKSSLRTLGRVETSDRYLVELPHLYHFCTDIEVSLNGAVTDTDLITALHPTPALGIFPKNNNNGLLEKIRQPQSSGASYLGSPFGFHWGKDQGIYLVALRFAHIKNDIISIPAGCGVVKESELQKEFLEIQGKMAATQRQLQL